MSHVFLIGGGPGSGKSSIAKKLSKEYGIEYWKVDNFVGEHQQEAADRKFPINNYINNLSEDEQQLELLKLTSKQELARQEELFFILIKELRVRTFDYLVLEGNCLLPNLVAQRFEYPYTAVWLLPEPKFQEKIYRKRDWAQELLAGSDDPGLLMKTWLKRDREYNEVVRNQAEIQKFPYLLVDGKKSIDDNYKWAKQKLKVTSILEHEHPSPQLTK